MQCNIYNAFTLFNPFYLVTIHLILFMSRGFGLFLLEAPTTDGGRFLALRRACCWCAVAVSVSCGGAGVETASVALDAWFGLERLTEGDA